MRLREQGVDAAAVDEVASMRSNCQAACATLTW